MLNPDQSRRAHDIADAAIGFIEKWASKQTPREPREAQAEQPNKRRGPTSEEAA